MRSAGTDSVRRIRLGLVGIGKIARDQHLPALAADASFDLVATASRHASLPDIPGHADITAMLAAGHALDAVSLCTPPAGRFEIAAAAIDAGLAVMLEKPPGATVSEVVALTDRARAAGVTLFTTWHSREAGGVDAARAWLADATIRAVRIDWREDIRHWHPGQDWILAAGGFGVFDPGINALSIATAILPAELRVTASRLQVPANRAAPIAASLDLVLGHDIPVQVEFDFLQTGPQRWDIVVETDRGTLALHDGGRRLMIGGVAGQSGPNTEYPRIYRHFADLIRAGCSDVDLRPLQLVADAFLLGQCVQVAPFTF
ncbi:MAG: galactose 1-dehydrogenase [Sphingomonas sp. 28-63-12]|nr:MAG: galactose 1-dehydrogenase [Sphingomonas sp. 28-63-12]